ncbi:MAG: DUF2185 domain-containing protein [Propionibacteriaceae bacterium]|jgi:hypothetical protein|nr:DUF2185 domain-containing protein [Propionibacteriaceae bacterium]
MSTGWPEFIPKAGACLVSKRILSGEGWPRWMVREPSKAPIDNGWRIFSHLDDAEYLADPNNLQIVDFNQVCAIQPALIGIWNFPVGSDLQMFVDDDGIQIADTPTGRIIPREDLYLPPAERSYQG